MELISMKEACSENTEFISRMNNLSGKYCLLKTTPVGDKSWIQLTYYDEMIAREN